MNDESHGLFVVVLKEGSHFQSNGPGREGKKSGVQRGTCPIEQASALCATFGFHLC